MLVGLNVFYSTFTNVFYSTFTNVLLMSLFTFSIHVERFFASVLCKKHA